MFPEFLVRPLYFILGFVFCFFLFVLWLLWVSAQIYEHPTVFARVVLYTTLTTMIMKVVHYFFHFGLERQAL